MPTETAMRIAITGATGMVGTALTAWMTARGHTVVPVSRQPIQGGIVWRPQEAVLDPAPFEGLDAVVHLAGENIAGGRWTASRKRQLRESRTGPTRLLATTLASLEAPPPVLVSASAMGIYGDRGEELISETSPLGTDFLARLARDWEAAADPARASGIRVVHPRFGIILSATGGALAKMLPTARLGMGGPLGPGTQWMSWVAIEDAAAAIHHLLLDTSISGAVNVATAAPVRNAEFAATLGQVLQRPAVVPVPAFALRLLFGEMADATLLASTRLRPEVLTHSGFSFACPQLHAALQAILG
jgi:uncharacterized protein (TIGR01777 family)